MNYDTADFGILRIRTIEDKLRKFLDSKKETQLKIGLFGSEIERIIGDYSHLLEFQKDEQEQNKNALYDIWTLTKRKKS